MLAVKLIFINTLQVVCLITLFQLSISANLSSVINISRPFVNFDLLESINQNVQEETSISENKTDISWFQFLIFEQIDDDDQPMILSSVLINAGYKTTNSIKNAGTLGLAVAFLYFILFITGVLNLIIGYQGDNPNKYLNKIHKFLIKKMFFNPFYELGLEGFIELLILTFLQLAQRKLSKSGDVWAMIFCCMIIGILVLLFLATVKMILTPIEKWQNDPILIKAEKLFTLQGTDNISRRSQKLIFIILRYLMVITVLFIKNPGFQVSIFISLNTIGLFYVFFYRPYEIRFLNQIEIVSYEMINMIFIFLLCFTDAVSSQQFKEYVGLLIVAILGFYVSILISIVSIYGFLSLKIALIKSMYSIRRYFEKLKEQRNPSTNQVALGIETQVLQLNNITNFKKINQDLQIKSERKFINFQDPNEDQLVKVFKAFLFKKRLRPLKTLDEAIQDFIVVHYPQSVSDQRKFRIILKRNLKNFQEVLENDQKKNKVLSTYLWQMTNEIIDENKQNYKEFSFGVNIVEQNIIEDKKNQVHNQNFRNSQQQNYNQKNQAEQNQNFVIEKVNLSSQKNKEITLTEIQPQVNIFSNQDQGINSQNQVKLLSFAQSTSRQNQTQKSSSRTNLSQQYKEFTINDIPQDLNVFDDESIFNQNYFQKIPKLKEQENIIIQEQPKDQEVLQTQEQQKSFESNIEIIIGKDNKSIEIEIDGPVYERKDFKNEDDFQKYLKTYENLCDQELIRMRNSFQKN